MNLKRTNPARTWATIAAGAMILIGTGCHHKTVDDYLAAGDAAMQSTKLPEAETDYQEAAKLAPNDPRVHIALGNLYVFEHKPSDAQIEFMKVLEKHPNDPTALASLASLAYQQAQGIPDLDAKYKKLDESKEWYTKLVQADPKNKEAWYSLGVIDWLKWYGNLLSARAKLGMKPDDPGPLKDKKVREELKAKWSATIRGKRGRSLLPASSG